MEGEIWQNRNNLGCGLSEMKRGLTFLKKKVSRRGIWRPESKVLFLPNIALTPVLGMRFEFDLPRHHRVEVKSLTFQQNSTLTLKQALMN